MTASRIRRWLGVLLGSSDSHNDALLPRRASPAPQCRSARHALADNPVLDSSKDVFDLTRTDIGIEQPERNFTVQCSIRSAQPSKSNGDAYKSICPLAALASANSGSIA